MPAHASRASSTHSANASRAEWLASQPPRVQQQFLASLSDQEIADLEFDWTFWARPNQLEPPGDWWITWLILAGRGWGKTRVGAETVRDWMCGPTPIGRGRYGRLALVAETAADARDVMVEGESGILSVHARDFRPMYEPSKRRLTWPNGAIATLYNAVEPDQLRGPQHDCAWGDELAKWMYARETWDMLQFGLRLGDRPRQIITTTPRPIAVLKEIIASPTTVPTIGSTLENRANLAPPFLKQIITRYEGTRLGRQELNAEILDDNPNALWTRGLIEANRVKPENVPPLKRIAVAIDPSGSNGLDDEATEIGIVAAGRGIDNVLYVMVDKTTAESPAGWGKTSVDLYDELGADRIVAETNFGGAMVEHVIRTVDPRVAFKQVTASRGKWIRAEPVAALFEQGRAKFVGSFPQLEDELCGFGPDGKADGKSPNRLDALVWAAADLMLADEEDVFGTSESDVLTEPLSIPRHWPRVFGLDMTRDRVSIVYGAHERATDTIWLYGEYSARRTDIAVHAGAIKDRGIWIPGVFDPRARDRSEEEGERIVDRLMTFKVELYVVESEEEALIEDLSSRLSTKRLRVFNTLKDWTAQYRNYRRDRRGDVVEEDDGLMKATGLLCTYGTDIAITDHNVEGRGDDDEELMDSRTKSSVTGY